MRVYTCDTFCTFCVVLIGIRVHLSCISFRHMCLYIGAGPCCVVPALEWVVWRSGVWGIEEDL